MNKWWVWVLVLITAVFLRTWRLDRAPIELFGDELDVGIQANSILHTGRDYLGHSWPVMFSSFAENRLPFLIYWTVPFVKALGLNEWSVRLPAAALGVISLLGLALLVRKLFDEKTALFTTMLLAVSPWHLQFSRWSSDNIGILIWAIFGVWLFVEGITRKKWWYLAAVVLAASFYSYSVATVFIPSLGAVLLWAYWDKIRKVGVSHWLVSGGIGLLVLLPFIWAMLVGSAAGQRFGKISVFSDQSIMHEIVTRRSSTPSKWTEYFRNKPMVYTEEIINNYLRSFSTEFLFFSGDPNLRHSVGNVGELYVFEIITLGAGLLYLVKNYKDNGTKLVLGWLLIAPLASALTKDGGNHAGRLIVMLPPLVIISGLGIRQLLPLWKKKLGRLFLMALLLLAAVNVSKYFYRYYIEWPRDSWRFWAQGYNEAFQYLKEHDQTSTRIYFNNTYEPILPRFLFWYNYDPARFQSQYIGQEVVKNIVPGFDGFGLDDKYYFGILENINAEKGFAQLLKPDELYLTSQRDEIGTGSLGGVKVEHTVVNPLNQPVFLILSKEDEIR